MIELIFLICAFNMLGQVDCDEQWVIVKTDILLVQNPQTGQWVSGVAVYGSGAMGKWSLCNQYPDLDEIYCGKNYLKIGTITRDGCWDGNCIPLLWHELKHLMCKCGWHDNMESEANTVIINIEGT